MNPLKKKLADFLIEKGKKGMNEMDPESPCAKSLRNLDREELLKKNIKRICDGISILEAGKILSLSAKFTILNTADADKYKREIKSIFAIVVKRVEKKSGNLNLPSECRDLLMNF